MQISSGSPSGCVLELGSWIPRSPPGSRGGVKLWAEEQDGGGSRNEVQGGTKLKWGVVRTRGTIPEEQWGAWRFPKVGLISYSVNFPGLDRGNGKCELAGAGKLATLELFNFLSQETQYLLIYYICLFFDRRSGHVRANSSDKIHPLPPPSTPAAVRRKTFIDFYH